MNDMRICLNMIVKNESAVISRCLESLKHILSYWVIVDTGSDDDTREKILETMTGIDGELHDRPWINFGHNRTEALQLAAGKGDYYLIIDADEELSFDASFSWPQLTADAYFIETKMGGTSYQRIQLVKASIPWRYEGVLHEYIHSDHMKTTAVLQNVFNLPHPDGARSSDPDKYRHDARLLEKALLDEPGNMRYVFYLAQSYRDAGETELAIHYYQQRVDMQGWPEEVWYSLYQIALLRQRKSEDWSMVLSAYLNAFTYRPSRMEPLYHIATYYRGLGQHHLALMYALPAENCQLPEDLLFVEKPIYEYLLPMELAIAAHWAGRYDLALAANNKILSNPLVPAAVFDQSLINREYTLEKVTPRIPFSGKKNRIKVGILFYNAGHFLDNCISSLLRQDYDNFEMIFIDDCSTDNAADHIPADDPRVTVIRNETNKGGAWNLHQCLLRCQPDDIFFQLDGDDWLACDDALSYVNRFFEETACWVMHGQFRFVTGFHGMARPFASENEFRRLRRDWNSPAPRIFRAGIYHRIADQDPAYTCMRNVNGDWYREAMDVAMIYPVFELAGFHRTRFNPKLLYVYNNNNPLNVHKARRPQEHANHLEISAKRPFAQISDYRYSDSQ